MFYLRLTALTFTLYMWLYAPDSILDDFRGRRLSVFCAFFLFLYISFSDVQIRYRYKGVSMSNERIIDWVKSNRSFFSTLDAAEIMEII